MKTLLVEGADGDVVALVLRGDHELNAVKSQKLAGRRESAAHGERRTGCARPPAATPASSARSGFAGKIYVDHAAAHLADFVCGANEKDMHFTRRELGTRSARAALRRYPQRRRRATPARPAAARWRSPAASRSATSSSSGSSTAQAMQASVLDEQGKALTMFMGCYGIGVTRVVAAAIEQNHDANGIIWPEALAPFQRRPGADQLSEIRARCSSAADELYEDFNAAGIDVLLDDRDARPGVKFADAELIGIPHRIVIGDRALAAGKLEYRHRRETESTEIPAADPVGLYTSIS